MCGLAPRKWVKNCTDRMPEGNIGDLPGCCVLVWDRDPAGKKEGQVR